MKKIFLLVLMCIFLINYGLPIEDVRLLRFPDINKELIAFVYAGDIWTVPSGGGDAQRLTSHEGLELFPKISPDGQWIAFSGEYSGSRQIYIMPSRGGMPTQLTYYNDVGEMPPRGGFDHLPLDWTPDSKQVLIRANRTPYGKRKGKYFLVNIEGGLETPLQIPEGGFGTFSPDGKQVVYTPIDRAFRTWKRYKGGRAQDIWVYDLVNDTSKQITRFTGTDRHPTWYNDKIYFVSDRDLILNFWSYDLKTKDFKKITHHKEFDVLWPSGHEGLVAYENGGYIYILDLDTGKYQKVTVNIHFDNPNRLPYFKNAAKFITRFGADISPEGKQVVFDARGDIFTVPAKKGVTANLTRTQDVREMFPAWSADGQWIAFISDKTGDYEIYLKDPKKKKETLQLTHNHKIWKLQPTWSPDSKKLLFIDTSWKLQVLDIQSKKITVMDKGYLDPITDYQWSADSQWVVYSKEDKNRLEKLRVYSLEKGKSYQLSSGKYNDFAPAFSRCGKYIFFLSDRDFDLNIREGLASLEFDYIYNKTTRIYAMALTKDAPHLFKEIHDLDEEDKPDTTPEVGKPKKGEKAKNGKSKMKPVIIDFDGIENRVDAFPLKPANYNFIADIGGKVLYGKDREFHLYDLKSRKDNPVIKGVQRVSISADKKKLLYKAEDKWGIIDIKPNQKPGAGELKLDDLVMKIDPGKEWRQIFNEGWRIYRDWFYVENMHGIDWQKIKEKYAPLLPYVSHRIDLDYIFSEMVAELNVGHAYVNYGDFKKVERMDTGLLGAELKADKKADRYKIVKIYQGENWNERTRSPLTEQGVNVKEGDYIIRLNGWDVFAKDNPYKFLENTAGKKITITVNAKPTETGARSYWIKPIKSELGLFYMDWVESRRKMVDQLSKGRIAYIHVPNTAIEGSREFFKGIYAYSDKEAFIIDDRYNGGGFTPLKMINKLAQRTVYYLYLRGLALAKDPTFALDGPMVMLINHTSGSGGDDFPYLFKKYNLGKLIGTRTWGGLVGLGWSPQLVDGAFIDVPVVAFVHTGGEFIVEGIGVSPDKGFEVIDRPEEIARGKDPSIEVAVKYLLEQLEKSPPKKTKKPMEPDRSVWHEKMKEK
ncbi:MAG: PD40 domain-containing protein [Candidatus Aminicenantes bacterium]|nr:MAG: PD40 domain-containing protein [Candidatus Aminicenantes bacterium]